jgi:hypothetical protein
MRATGKLRLMRCGGHAAGQPWRPAIYESLTITREHGAHWIDGDLGAMWNVLMPMLGVILLVLGAIDVGALAF